MARKSFKTAKGTELPLLNLKGKEYLAVANRLLWFEEENPRYTIATSLRVLTESDCVAEATVEVFDAETKIVRRVTGIKQETKTGFPDFIEKAQTGAIGRALAMLGYGTQFTGDELDEGTVRIVDAPLEPRSSGTVSPLKATPGGFKAKLAKGSASSNSATDDL